MDMNTLANRVKNIPRSRLCHYTVDIVINEPSIFKS